jgi:hypothetical protein
MSRRAGARWFRIGISISSGCSCGESRHGADAVRRFFQQLTEEMKDQMIRYRKTLDVSEVCIHLTLR